MENSVDRLIGIIIPAYNVEKYIFRAIESCISQTFSNVEIIIVDDGSSDDTLSVAKRYAERDCRVQVYTQENKGVSSARNFALQVCKAEYIMFLDSDDWLEPTAVEKLCEHLPKKEEKSLIATDAYYAYFVQGSIQKMKAPFIADYTEIDAENILPYIAKAQYKLQSSCYKLFSMSLIREKELCFDENIRHGEDGLFVFEYLKHADSFVYFPDTLWNILERPGSATQAPYNHSWLSAVDAISKMMEYNNSHELDTLLKCYRVQRMTGVLCHAVLEAVHCKEDVAFLRRSLRKEVKQYLLNEKSIKNRAFFLFVTFSPIKIVAAYCKGKI